MKTQSKGPSAQDENMEWYFAYVSNLQHFPDDETSRRMVHIEARTVERMETRFRSACPQEIGRIRHHNKTN